MSYYFSPISSNRTTGPIPVVTSPASTCPASCGLLNAGCYAQQFPMSLRWGKLGVDESNFDQIVRAVEALPTGTLWRYGQAGDLPGTELHGLLIDRPKLLQLARASIGKPALVYTHKPVMMEQYKPGCGVDRTEFSSIAKRNRGSIRLAGALGFRINVSCETIRQARRAVRMKLPAVLVVPSTFTKPQVVGGVQLSPCPHKIGMVRDCLDCKGLCARPRDAVVAFPAHGNRSRRIDERVAATSTGWA